jgi:predicted DNA-binding protein with PD1-like motif
MKTKQLHQAGPRTFAVVFDKDDEVIEGLTAFTREHAIAAAQITAIGAFKAVTLGFFDPDAMDYKKFGLPEQVEVLSLIGDVAEKDGEAQIHAHVVVGRSDGSTRGGHLFEGVVWPTLEVILTEVPSHLRKKVDEETGLALIDL